jgi:hypothetical protein
MEFAMKRWLGWLALLGLVSVTFTGYYITMRSPNPAERSTQLMVMSEHSGPPNRAINRNTFMDDPSILDAQRNSGVIGP